MKTLVTYVHYRSVVPHNDDRDELSDTNLNFFVKRGIIDSDDVHYNFIINSEECNVSIPHADNISIIKGHNEGYDFGGYAQSLEAIDLNQFDRFIFINDTCRGPFIPEYIPDDLTWIDMFLTRLSHKVKLIGPTWNIKDSNFEEHEEWSPHIQSYCFGTDRQGIELLIERGVFDLTEYKTRGCKNWLILNHEIRMSKEIIDGGYNIKPFMLSQHNKLPHGNVTWRPNLYFDMSLCPLEAMFYKTPKGELGRTKELQNYTDWLLAKDDQARETI